MSTSSANYSYIFKKNKLGDLILNIIQKIFSYVFLCFLLFLIFHIPIIVGSCVIGTQLIRSQDKLNGYCAIFFGFLTLGVWPFLFAKKECKKIKNELFYKKRGTIKKFLSQNHNIAIIVLIIFIMIIFGVAVASFVYIIYLASIYTSRADRLRQGVYILYFGWLSLIIGH